MRNIGISFDSSSLIDRKLLSWWPNNFIPVLKANLKAVT